MKHRPSGELAEAVRRACLRAALRALEDAGIQGLCAEGRWEAAVSAIRKLDLEGVAERMEGEQPGRDCRIELQWASAIQQRLR